MDYDEQGTASSSSTGSDPNVVVRDTVSEFACGPSGFTCQPATPTSVPADRWLGFVLLFRHGTFELYIQNGGGGGEEGGGKRSVGADRMSDTDLLLVQTSRYGTYPQAAASVGFAVSGPAGSRLELDSLEAWEMSL